MVNPDESGQVMANVVNENNVQERSVMWEWAKRAGGGRVEGRGGKSDEGRARRDESVGGAQRFRVSVRDNVAQPTKNPLLGDETRDFLKQRCLRLVSGGFRHFFEF